MYAVTAEEMRLMDNYTINELQLPGAVLMENAGARIVEELMKLDCSRLQRILILAGHGNNGGDGAVVARRLQDEGLNPTLWFVGDASRVNDSKAYVLAVDLPSGLHSDTGQVHPIAIKAHQTITFVFPKRGFFLQSGPLHIGDWKAVEISVPRSLVKLFPHSLPEVIQPAVLKQKLPERPTNGHKGTFGHVLVIGGSTPYVGAPTFSAQAALAGGAGLVTLATPASLHPIVSSAVPEALQLPLHENRGQLSIGCLEQLAAIEEKVDVVAIGPGLNRFEEAETIVMETLRLFRKKPIIMDADALYAVRNRLDEIKSMDREAIIMTPHPGEMATLCNCSVNAVEEDRLGIATSFSKKYNVHLILKGHRTIIAGPDEKLAMNPYGNDALGKGGSGDVLTGLIAAFIAQQMPIDFALRLAVYLHATAGEECGQKYSSYSVLPPFLIDGIRKQLRQFTDYDK